MAALRAGEGGHVFIHGSAELARRLSEAYANGVVKVVYDVVH